MNVTTANFAWTVVAIIAAGWFIASVQEWLHDRYEATWTGRRLHVARRWYGTGSRVRHSLSGSAHQVIGWDDESTAVPWLLVGAVPLAGEPDPDSADEPFWAPVTDFAPLAVRKFPFGLGYRPAPAR